MTTPHLIGSAEAAERLGIHRNHFNKLVAMGAIPVAMQMKGETGARLFSPAAIDAYKPNIKKAAS